MKEEVLKFIQNSSFPCIMAKAVAKTGHLKVHSVSDLLNPQNIQVVQQELYQFIDTFRKNPKKLSSFILILSQQQDFNHFEKNFWSFLSQLHQQDKLMYKHDPRVSDAIENENFSYSLKSEAFFILALHPQSPRLARRFYRPAIVFNPHLQFEQLRQQGMFTKIRNTIRHRDKLLQGTANPMLNDFGERSEVFQYTGKIYSEHDTVPLNLGDYQ